MLAAVERRLEESLNLDPEQLPMGDWDAAYEQILAKIEAAFAKRHDRYIGQAQDGLIAKDITTTLNKLTGAVTEIHLLTLLMQMRAGQRATFDRKTKRRVWKRTTRMSYVYYAASFLKDQDEEEIIKDVFDHLENAKTALSRAWGFSELSRLANTPIKNLAKPAREGLQRALNGEMTDTALEQPLGSVNPEKYPVVIDELGRQATTQLYR
ncbi:MAG: hypothetical protein GY803_06900, partial [Chloroflexi bacterium]|nr:hypothetical protein [Chloroflexota bacterium]